MGLSRLLLFLLMLWALQWGSSQANNTLRINGSDLLKEPLNSLLRAKAEAMKDALDLAFDGTYFALQQMELEEIDIAFAAVPEGEHLPENREVIPLAYLTSILVVHRDNPLKSLSLDLIKGLYSSQAKVDIHYWHELGFTNSWQSRGVVTHVVDTPEVLHLQIFRAMALEGGDLKVKVKYWQQASSLLDHLKQHTSSIGVLPMHPLVQEQPGLRVLPIASDVNGIPFPPDPQKIHSGDYPIRLAFFVVYQADHKKALRPYLGLLLEDATAKGLSNHGFVPVPSLTREQERFKLDWAQ